MSDGAERWAHAALAACILALDPPALGGAIVRARNGPARDAWLDLLRSLASCRRLPPSIGDDELLGGLDLAATLKAGRPVARAGVLTAADGHILIVPMAERMAPGLAGHLGAVLDRGRVVAERAGRRIDTATRLGLVLLDEGAEPDETVPDVLKDRLALHLSLDGIALGEIGTAPFSPENVAKAQSRLTGVRDNPEHAVALTRIATALGIGSLRPALHAMRAARAAAALAGRDIVQDEDIATAAALVLAPRAIQMPGGPEEEETPPRKEPQDQQEGDENRNENQTGALEDKVLDAVRTALPADLLADPAGTRRRGAGQAGAGQAQKSLTHGRPAGTIARPPGDGVRTDVVATLRAAAPWQGLRRRDRPDRTGVIVETEDFRARRFVRPAESVMIFLVDASGSAAAARLAEAKGAVEYLLAQAYQRREKVALIAFRGTGAELLLAPTRSLVQAKRKLSVLPGGGGTPLAAGLLAGRELARQVAKRGATPFLVVLTDGRGNIGLDGQPGRAAAAEDAERAARVLHEEAVASVVIDTANRPQRTTEALARTMGGRYLPLPRADAAGLARAIRTATAA